MNTPQAAIDEVHRRIGRNLLRFQEIEVGLKLILPYIHPDGGAKGIDALEIYRREKVTSKTLGPLFEELDASMTASPDFFETSMPDLVKARNDLVHHFYELPAVDLLRPDGASQAVVYLDRQFNDAEEWARIVKAQSLLVLVILMDANPTLGSQYGIDHEKLLAQLPAGAGVEYIDQVHPSRTTWAATPIVKLLKEAEADSQRADGMTLLSAAGHHIRAHAPEHTHGEYGFKTLKQILDASQLFDVSMDDDGTTMLYKSRAELP